MKAILCIEGGPVGDPLCFCRIPGAEAMLDFGGNQSRNDTKKGSNLNNKMLQRLRETIAASFGKKKKRGNQSPLYGDKQEDKTYEGKEWNGQAPRKRHRYNPHRRCSKGAHRKTTAQNPLTGDPVTAPSSAIKPTPATTLGCWSEQIPGRIEPLCPTTTGSLRDR